MIWGFYQALIYALDEEKSQAIRGLLKLGFCG